MQCPFDDGGAVRLEGVVNGGGVLSLNAEPFYERMVQYLDAALRVHCTYSWYRKSNMRHDGNLKSNKPVGDLLQLRIVGGWMDR